MISTITDVKMTDVASTLQYFGSFRIDAWMFLLKNWFSVVFYDCNDLMGDKNMSAGYLFVNGIMQNRDQHNTAGN